MAKWVTCGIAILLGLTTIADTTAFARSHRVINDKDTVVLRGNRHQHARPEIDAGATDNSLPMERMVLSLRLSPEKQAELDLLLDEQQDPASPNFHRWLTPEEFGERFGPSTDDIDAITGWLTSNGFAVEEVGKGRTWINFSGAVSNVERALHTKIRNYNVDGHLRHANATDPAIPRGLADLVTGVVSLHNFPRKSMRTGVRALTAADRQPAYTSGGYHSLAPGDFATIYNVTPLYNAGIDGTGQTIAIVGRTHPSSANWDTFRSTFGLPANSPIVRVNGADPGDQGEYENGEADLDVEWSGAVARNATIMFVTSKSTYTTDGVDLSAQYIVNNNLAPVMSTSFGACESQMGASENAFYNNLWKQAAAQGITSFVSSGDSGASGCDGGSDSSGSGLGVNGLASTPYNVAVGGTQFDDASGSYWNSANGTNGGSAKSYIPEVAWNESANEYDGSDLWSTGGGASLIYGKPSWQVSPGVPPDGKRDIPDVSLTAAGHVGYRVRTEEKWYIFGGTSASSPAFAGLMALIVQKTGQRQGNANPRFYQLGNAQYSSGGAAVFHDTITGNNSVPGVTGYYCTTGYDLATGLGSVDATALVNAFSPLNIAPAITSPTSVTLVTGVPTSFTVVSTGNPVPSISMTGILPGGVTFIDNGNGSATISGSAAAIGIYPVTITAANAAGSINQGLTLNVGSNKGDMNGDGKVNVTDALLALRTSVVLYNATPEEIARADVAPFINGVPVADGNIDLSDALMILKKAVGLAVF